MRHVGETNELTTFQSLRHLTIPSLVTSSEVEGALKRQSGRSLEGFPVGLTADEH